MGDTLFFNLEEQDESQNKLTEGVSGNVVNIVLSEEEDVPLTSDSPKYKTPTYDGQDRYVSIDFETTGTDPWDYRFIVASLWDISTPISEEITFAGWDEEQLTQDVVEAMKSFMPCKFLVYNGGFEQRCLMSRMLLYQVPFPGWNDIEWIDVMDLMKKGTWSRNVYSSQSAGSEEDWLFYFFGEKKPYNIDECFEGVREGDLTRMVLRNRTCVQGVGEMYILFLKMTEPQGFDTEEFKPSAVFVDEAQEAGICNVECPACKAVNTVPCSSKANTCWRCLGDIPDPSGKNVIKETLRDYDFTKVGLKNTKSTTKSTTTTKKQRV